ncbi:AAA family ATPase [Serratia marcescens]|uniref:AAA family ATPase n=1 Tax=Serratia marcescens TaxID=615 RepID=UPI002761F314|nr:AAA family ATPase [Serratia marcescens]MDP8670614.1 AAA family ATPase [Serratia marcescens]MDP8695274.1 AAA family ATPase [Serratia marcescens]MDP8724937.1 AAA family ATPase [Serratia marcescens]
MYKIQSVAINGFWQRLDCFCSFNDDVNIIIGRNGTGKTTFMNILHSILSLDFDGINNNDFNSAEIKLKDGRKSKTIKINKIENETTPFSKIQYQLSSKKYNLRVMNTDDRRFPLHYRRRVQEESEELRSELEKLVALSSLSVYRLRNSDDLEVRDKYGTRFINPVDYKLSELMQELTKYQLELSQQARDIALELQKEVLASILYSKEDIDDKAYNIDFDKEKEKQNLLSAYTQLNAIDYNIRRKINFHVDNIDNTISKLKQDKKKVIDIRSIEALRKTQKIIKMSLTSKDKTSQVFAPIEQFLSILKEFVTDKTFEFLGGELFIKNSHGPIKQESLSSGEKQLLILFIETLLQREQQYIFITDEPELSLHIQWQRNIIPAIKKLNPNAQIIAATHSPEVASKYKESIFNMEKLVNVTQ